MTQISTTTQISIFSLIQSAILSDEILSKKFKKTNLHQFEPKLKSPNFTGFPYIWVDVPSTESNKIVFDNSVVLKDFEIDMFLRMEYMAKDNYILYANRLIKCIESYEDTFQSAGYYDVMIELVDTDSNQVIHQKELIEGYFVIKYKGQVAR